MLSEFVPTETTPPLSEGWPLPPPPPLPDTTTKGTALASTSLGALTLEADPLSLGDRPLSHWLPGAKAWAVPTLADELPTASASADPLTAWAPLSAAWQTAQVALDDFLRSPQRDASLALTFGAETATGEISSVVQDLIAARSLPKVEVMSATKLAAQGAYVAETETIFLAKELFGQPEQLLRVFLEELGHFIDDRVNAVDAPGDEGALFAAQVLGDDLDAAAIAALQAEDDSATLTVGHQTWQVEQADLGPGTFTVSTSGQIVVEFLVDSGAYKGQLAVFSLNGMAELTPGSPAFIQEAARRALSNSAEGYVVINDIDEGASLSGRLGERDRNAGPAPGAKPFTFPAGAQVAVMLVPHGTVAAVLENPTAEGRQRPLFSLASANPLGRIHIGQIRPGVFAMEDVRFDGKSDGDFNDVIFRLEGVAGQIEPINTLLESRQVWLNTPLGQQLFLLPDSNSNTDGGPFIPPGFIAADNPIFPPVDAPNLQVSIPTGDGAKFTATSSEAEIAATGAARITVGTQTIYIGTNQVSSLNQNPIVASFDSANPANNWIRTDYEVTGADGRGLGIAWDGASLYAVFSVDGTQGDPSQDFRRAANDAEQGWLRSYGAGGGAKVSVLGRVNPANGELLDAAYLSAILSNGNSNSLSVSSIGVNSSGNLVIDAQSFFSPRRPNGTALTQITPGSSPFAYTVEITPDLKRIVSTSAPGWA